MPELTILIPTLGRADALQPLLANIREATPPNYHVRFIVDDDDFETRTALARLAIDYPAIRVLAHSGSYPQKINAGADESRSNWLLCGADDLYFHDGWWWAAKSQMAEDIGVIGTNDLHMGIKQEHFSTHPLVARWYIDKHGTIDEKGKVMHEGYRHNQVDVELCLTARRRGMYAYAEDAIVEHRHAIFTGAPLDETHKRGMLNGNEADLALIAERRKLLD